MRPVLNVRLTIDGEVVDDREVGMESASPLSRRHVALVEDAEDRGATWLVEITDPDGLMDPLVASNDPDLLDNPVELNETNAAREQQLREHQLRHRRTP